MAALTMAFLDVKEAKASILQTGKVELRERNLPEASQTIPQVLCFFFGTYLVRENELLASSVVTDIPLASNNGRICSDAN